MAGATLLGPVQGVCPGWGVAEQMADRQQEFGAEVWRVNLLKLDFLREELECDPVVC